MLKLENIDSDGIQLFQPPSGGCVLKQVLNDTDLYRIKPAAFRRLCVETSWEKLNKDNDGPAAFRRLCVETLIMKRMTTKGYSSRLQAAVC